jgi:hypothetical protein
MNGGGPERLSLFLAVKRAEPTARFSQKIKVPAIRMVSALRRCVLRRLRVSVKERHETVKKRKRE